MSLQEGAKFGVPFLNVSSYHFEKKIKLWLAKLKKLKKPFWGKFGERDTETLLGSAVEQAFQGTTCQHLPKHKWACLTIPLQKCVLQMYLLNYMYSRLYTAALLNIYFI